MSTTVWPIIMNSTLPTLKSASAAAKSLYPARLTTVKPNGRRKTLLAMFQASNTFKIIFASNRINPAIRATTRKTKAWPTASARRPARAILIPATRKERRPSTGARANQLRLSKDSPIMCCFLTEGERRRIATLFFAPKTWKFKKVKANDSVESFAFTF